MHEIFVDTGAWLAIVDKSDSLHKQAQQIYASVIRSGSILVTTNLVVSESYTLIQRRIGQKVAVQFLSSVQNSPRLLVIYSDSKIETDAQKFLRQYADQKFSYVDAVSFAVMKQREIVEAFAFDHHFLIAGFSFASDTTD